MCCTLGPAKLSNTILYAAEVDLGDGKTVHAIGYQNMPRNLILGEGLKGNAMLLPFPAKPATMSSANSLDTRNCPRVLEDMAGAVRPMTRGPVAKSFSAADRVTVFDQGIYTIVLADDPTRIPDALPRVPRDRRPKINKAVFDFYAERYPGWPVALCCFNNLEAKLGPPMLWWYRPLDSRKLFLPALDAHDGMPPSTGAEVEVDHTVIVGSHKALGGVRVGFRDQLPRAVRPFILNMVTGGSFTGAMPNGDFVCRVADVRKGIFRPKRVAPESPAAQFAEI